MGMADKIHACLLRAAALMTCWLLASPISFAHPMGNFSVSHYAGIRVEQGFVEVQYLIDMAEIPTFQEMQKNNLVAQAGDPQTQAYLSGQASAFARELILTVNGKSLQVEIASQNILFTAGAGGLTTMKLGFFYRAQADCPVTRCELEYKDLNFPGRVGWKEVIALSGTGVTIERSSVPLEDRSDQLSNYPADLIKSPPADVAATILYSSGKSSFAGSSLAIPRTAIARIADESHSLPLRPNQQATPRSSFTELMTTQHLSFGVVLLAAFIAAGLGALHALEPGHGKTIVAAYLVGSKGTPRHACLLGLIVTVSHTAGVYLLGGITLYAQKYVLPDRIYPFLGVLSGILIAGMGCYLFLQRFLGGEFTHAHEFPESSEERSQGAARRHRPISARQLLLLGTTGGIVPCPAALVVLLSAVALHRTGFGLFLIVTFSVGLAAVLIAMGLAAVYAGRMMSWFRTEGPLVQRWLPLGSAVMITALGCVIAVRGPAASGIFSARWSF